MYKRSLPALIAISLAISGTADAQQALIKDKREITGYAARAIIEACMAQATRDHFPIALAVTNSAGNLMSFQTMEGSTDNTGLTAQLKARTAAIFRRDTGDLYERTNKQINRAAEWIGYFPVPGGFPIVINGEVVGGVGAGAAGVSGGKDQDCAKNAIRTVMGDGKSVAPASPQPLLETRKVLTMAAARRLIDACVAYADQKNYTALGISVVDPDGTLMAFQGTEGAHKTALDTAELKAKAAAKWQRPTSELWERINKQVNRAPEFMGDLAQPGGFPIFVGKDMIGAIGAGGGIGDQDDECAQAAVKAVFPDGSITRPS
jgi:glc operon protein GlcG